MNELQLVVLGLMALVISMVLFYFTDIVPPQIENREISIIISLSIGLLILFIDKRQDRHIDEMIQMQHKTTHEIHKMIREQMNLIKEIQNENLKTQREGLIVKQDITRFLNNSSYISTK
jgi:hypothetical protein